MLFEDSPFETDFELAKQILSFGAYLTDTTAAGKTRDIYCFQLFNFENVFKLLEEGDFIDATFFFAFATWTVVIFSTSIDLQFRIFLNELSFQMIYTFYENIADFKKKGIVQNATEKSFTIAT